MFYLIGKTLGHSYSAEIHRRFGRYGYELRPMPPEMLAPFFAERDFEGLNVTIPYKSAVLPYLDEIDAEARAIGSVNTVEKRGERLIGHNTDYAGLLAMLRRAGVDLSGKKVLILGSGGTSLTAQAVARDEGAGEIVVLSRSGGNSYADLPRHFDSEVIVNATPVGMYPQNGESLLSLGDFPHLSGVVDVIYNPHRTKLIDEAERRGIPASGGLYMLVAQAAAAAGYFSREPIADRETDRVYRELLTEKQNIVLVGMPGSGKSTVAALLAKKTDREVIDTDEWIAWRAGMAIPEIFKRCGEAEFRRLEAEAIREAGKRSSAIIATGGGAVLDAENRYPLAQNGKIYFLTRRISELARTGRPLSANADLEAMYASRLPHYLSFADVTVANDSAPSAAAERILEDFYAHPDFKRTQS